MSNQNLGPDQYNQSSDPNQQQWQTDTQPADPTQHGQGVDPNQRQWQQNEDQSGLVGEGPTDESGLAGSGSLEDPYQRSTSGMPNQGMPNQAGQYDQPPYQQQRDDEMSAGSTSPHDPNAPQQDQVDPNMPGTASDAGMPQNPAQADNQY